MNTFGSLFRIQHGFKEYNGKVVIKDIKRERSTSSGVSFIGIFTDS